MAEANDLHPAPEVLSDFALGKMDEGAIAIVAGHLSDCGTCRDAATTATDGLLDLLRPDRAATAALTTEPTDPPDPHAPPAALRNHPRYRILRCLGRGGMGTVYLAEHRLMKRQRAIKVTNPALIGDERAVERFVREVELLARLRHPNIVQAYDAEKADGLYLLAMEFIEGETLAQVVEREGPLPVGSACGHARQAAQALQYAHEQGLVHRDIKPSNLMRTADGRVKVLDFGLARLASESRAETGLTHENATMGTPDYLAPEQALDARQADICADIYSLGCTLFYLLTGKPPFAKPSPLAVSAAHLHEPPPSLRDLRPDAPAGLCHLVQNMLAKLPSRRPQTPGEVAAALAQFEGHQLVSPPDAPRGRRRRWAAIAVSLLSAVTLLVLAAVLLRVHTPQGTIVLEHLPAGAEVLLNGERVTLRAGDNEQVEIGVRAGKKHQLQVKKDGITIFGTEVEVATGGRQPIRVRLEEGPAPDDTGFVSLFNGRDLTGWHKEGAAHWSAENGALVGRGTSYLSRGYLISERDYADFVLRFEFLAEAWHKDNGAGVAFRAVPRESLPHGGQLWFDHPMIKFYQGGSPGMSHWVKDHTNDYPPTRPLSLPMDQWHAAELVVRGDRCVFRVDGHKATELRLEDGEKDDIPALARARGRIGFYQDEGQVRVRNIAIKPLP